MTEVILCRENERWVARLGRYRFETQVGFPLAPASESLFRIVTAIHNIYPKCRVWLDATVTENPFIAAKIFASQYYGLTPTYADVQYALDNPEVKTCTVCGGKSYYNVDWRGWVCANRGCGAHEGMDGRYFKLSRWAVKRGGW